MPLPMVPAPITPADLISMMAPWCGETAQPKQTSVTEGSRRRSVAGGEGIVAIFGMDADHDAGGVVFGSGVEHGPNQFVAGGLQGMGVGEDVVDLVVLEVAQNAIGGQQQNVAILGGELGEVGGNGVLGAESAGDDVLGG